MRKTTVLLLGWALVGSAWAQVSQKNVQGNATIDAFWEGSEPPSLRTTKR
ncbi:hypothetical protein BH20ACI3_BH20ACI3_12900 [soil metagenome]